MGDRVLICGDSYSDPTKPINDYPPTNAWVDKLRDDFDVVCLAQVGANNEEILNQAAQDVSRDFTLISLAPLARGDNLKQMIKSVYQITQIKNCYVWSPFRDYASVKGVDWQPFVSHNEFYIKLNYFDAYVSRHYQFTGCHFTHQGNELVYEHMKYIITQRITS